MNRYGFSLREKPERDAAYKGERGRDKHGMQGELPFAGTSGNMPGRMCIEMPHVVLQPKMLMIEQTPSYLNSTSSIEINLRVPRPALENPFSPEPDFELSKRILLRPHSV